MFQAAKRQRSSDLESEVSRDILLPSSSNQYLLVGFYVKAGFLQPCQAHLS